MSPVCPGYVRDKGASPPHPRASIPARASVLLAALLLGACGSGDTADSAKTRAGEDPARTATTQQVATRVAAPAATFELPATVVGWKGEGVCEATGKAPALPYAGERFPADKGFGYEVDLQMSGELDMGDFLRDAVALHEGGALSQKPPTTWTISIFGQLSVEPARGAAAAPMTLRMRLAIEKLVLASSDQTASDEELEAMRTILEAPFAVELDGSDAPIRLRAGAEVPPQAVNVLTSLVQELALRVPTDGLAPAWSAKEDELMGRFDYCHQATALADGSVRVDKMRVRDAVQRTFTDGGTRDVATKARVRGGRTYTLDAEGGFLAALKVDEQVDLRIEEREATGKLVTSGTIARTATWPLPEGATIEAPDGPVITFGEALTDEEDFSTEDVSNLAAKLHEITNLDPAKMDRVAQYNAIADLGKILKSSLIEPSDVRKFADDPNTALHTWGVLLAGIARCGRADLAPILVDALRIGTKDMPRTTLAMMALLHAESPTAEMTEALRPLAAGADMEIAAQAMAILGVVAKRLDNVDPAGHAATMTWILEQIRKSDDWPRRALALTALGNAGDAGKIGVLTEYAAKGPAYSRVRAVEGLRFIDTEEADGALVSYLLNDESQAVRIAAGQSLAFKKSPAGLAAFSQVLRGTAGAPATDDVKKQLMMSLVAWAGDIRSAALLHDVADRDTSESVRTFAEKLLAGWDNHATPNGK